MTSTETRSLTPAQIARYAREGAEFHFGKLTGTPGKVDSTGDLPQGLAAHYKAQRKVRYSVTSDDTLIAYVNRTGAWILPEHDFGGAIGRHQNMVRLAAGRR